MSSDTVEKVITNAIHTAFIKYPEGDGGPNLDYEWIPPEQSSHITKAILFGPRSQRISDCKKGLGARIRASGKSGSALPMACATRFCATALVTPAAAPSR